MFAPITSRKAPQLIISQIRSAILQGKVAPGEKFPSSQELMDEFGVSKATLREALRALEHLGLIEIRKGAKGGMYATEVDMKTFHESLVNFLQFKNVSAQHLSEIRMVLEPYAAEVAAKTISAEELHTLNEINETCWEALREGRHEEVRKALVGFHRVIAECSGNPLLIFILTFVNDLLEDTKRLLKPEDRFFRSVLEAHKCIYDALVKQDAQAAFEEMYKDVSNVGKHLTRTQNIFLEQAENMYAKTD